jgi:uncharacterized membrane protein YGL010W
MAKRTTDQWLDEYGEYHKNKVNKLIHWLCVPLIMASILALLWELPTPTVFHQVPYLNWSTLVIAGSLLFYVRLSLSLATGMALISVAVVVGVVLIQSLNILPVWKLALGIFVVAWIGQAIGHWIEGKKPSFFNDLTFLLIGPIWLLSAVYRRVGISY